MKKSETQPKTVQGTAMAKIESKPQTPALIVLPKQAEQTPEELKKEIEALKRKIATVPEDLEERIVYYNQKKDWIKKLEKIKMQRDKLIMVQNDLLADLENDEFMSENFSFAVFKKKQYSSEEEILKVNNPMLVGVILKNVLSKMSEKIDELEINIAS